MRFNEKSTRQKIVNINSHKTLFYLCSIEISKCSDSCNKIDDPYAKLYLPDVIKDINVKVFNLMSRTNEAKLLKWHEPCKCKCRLDASISNKQHWNSDKCRCEWKELIDKIISDEGFICNCEYKCDKSFDVRIYLDYENCKCRKRLIDKLVKECSESIDENKMTNIILK